MRNLIRAAIVGLFLFTLHAAQPAAQQPTCGEYVCYINMGGNGWYCVEEGTIECICNNNGGCMCGECYCFDGGDCYLMPWQG
jgi:hypothetical protein